MCPKCGNTKGIKERVEWKDNVKYKHKTCPECNHVWTIASGG